MAVLAQAVDLIMHLDTHLGSLAQSYNTWVYALLFGIVFCESAFIITPFLPGDSLLFAAGSIAALGYIHIDLLIVLLLIAAISGGSINYWLGRLLGKHMPKHGRWIKRQHITNAHDFFEKYGANAVIIARFVPIIRTFVPFVAGFANMTFKKFSCYNAIGAFIWVLLLTGAGYFFGNLPMVKAHFGWIVIAIIIISLIPTAVSLYQHHSKKTSTGLIQDPRKDI